MEKSQKLISIGEDVLDNNFVELWYKKENFTIIPDNKDEPILQEQILSVPNSKKGELTSTVAISIETYTKFDNTKMPSRVVIVNENGERLLDTLVKVDDSMLVVKAGQRTQLKNFAKIKGPSLEAVREKVLELITGRTVVGYHTLLKISDIGLYTHLSLEDMNNALDCSVMFNDNGSSPQQQIKQLCKDHLNLVFNKRPFPYSHTEAKICMALYQQWKLKRQAMTANSPLKELLINHQGDKENLKCPNHHQDQLVSNLSDLNIEEQPPKKERLLASTFMRIDEEPITVTGSQLKTLIKEHVHEFFKEELKMLLQKLAQ